MTKRRIKENDTSKTKERVLAKEASNQSPKRTTYPVQSSRIHFPPTLLHDSINPLSDKEAGDAETKQAGGDAPEPSEVSLVLLSGHPNVHAPHAGNNVHGQHDGSEDGELAENVGSLLGALVHADVDLGEVVAVGAGEEAAKIC